MSNPQTPLCSRNPADGSIVWEGPAATPDAITAAVLAGRKAFPEWSLRPVEERIGYLKAFAAALGQARECLARTISREIGKPLPEALGEVKAMIGKVDISLRAFQERCREFSGGAAVTRFKPHGLVAVLGPYNFPGHLPNGHIVPALLAGNTVIFKPSEVATATAEATLACWREAGLPEGVLQVLQGEAETARQLVADPGVNGVFFTGSARTGKLLARQFADTPGRVLALEMGGNNPLLVDTAHLANLALAAEVTIQSAFLSAGQRCTCARRLIVIDSPQAGAFLDELVRQSREIRVGDPFAEPAPFMGPMAAAAFADAMAETQAERLESGAESLLEAVRGDPETGFISPGILDVTDVRELADEEIFGPLLQVQRVPDLDTAIEAANRTRYGLAAGVLSDSEAVYRYAWSHLRAGIINWNTQLTGASSAAPFGGIGDSGNLRPSAFFAADYCSYPVASMERASLTGS
jgi:succinylglutamic semialdehyde dehydrogenase